MMILLLCAFVLVSSLMLTGMLRRYALARSLIDVPNGRSSHSVATPRGGGVAIVLGFLIALSVLAWIGILPWSVFWALFVAGSAVAIVGFLDDHGHIAARWRLLAHFLASFWMLFCLGGMPAINFFGAEVSLGWLGHILAAFYLVWMLNLYNFMDGIDGIASVEAIFVCFGACLVYKIAGYEGLVWAPLCLALAVAGFLYWNFPPARIFMGDVGSGFLGIMMGGLSLHAAWHAPHLLWVWLIFLGVFIVDATFTLGRRLLRGDKVYEAHRSHAYQFASRQAGRHLPVTLVVLGINVVWLLPIGLCVGLSVLDGFTGLVLAYAPLVPLAVRFHAGELEKVV
ncbi:glycosyl transferase [Pseudomonas agarici]|uniref:Glycosyl transferase n=1 Tax=Pseudomonas agarici TaxID=46677 RepID=A0A0X1T6F2_PSEAA|nr:glycosyltransferase family 4 protein [Pseudomonas agarici]AMB87668.1 glycosyl transferase [Pseudomonas agarici]NWC10866.1 glycosyltransferase family 4 protein [Pseudomonas agarici]SEK91925.1 Fuc2NAc and GlcNAc transferase [Pseudomonas agarici]